jgi:hypothetical protein
MITDRLPISRHPTPFVPFFHVHGNRQWKYQH